MARMSMRLYREDSGEQEEGARLCMGTGSLKGLERWLLFPTVDDSRADKCLCEELIFRMKN